MSNLRNQVRDHFLSDGNTRWLHATVQERLTQKLRETTGDTTPVRVPLDDFFLVGMQQVAEASLNPAPGTLGLAAMNRTFLNRTLNEQWQAIVGARLYNQYEISQNRARTHPYGEYTAKDGNVTISASAYNLSHPWAKQRDSFLMATTGLARRSAPSAAAQAVQAQREATQGHMFVDTQGYCRGTPAQQALAAHQ
jgi:hypothetical protein